MSHERPKLLVEGEEVLMDYTSFTLRYDQEVHMRPFYNTDWKEQPDPPSPVSVTWECEEVYFLTFYGMTFTPHMQHIEKHLLERCPRAIVTYAGMTFSGWVYSLAHYEGSLVVESLGFKGKRQ